MAVERGGAGYLAVWTDERAVLSGFVNTTGPLNGNGQDIYGQLLDGDGLPVGAPIVIANEGHNQSNPDLAWNESANSWLVVFDSQDPQWYFHDQVYGVRVAADGSVLDAEPQLIFEQDGNQGIVDVDVASDGTNWAVVASKFQGSPLQGTIIGSRLSADGIQMDLQPKILVQGDVMKPDIAYANGTYMIVWSDLEDATGGVFGTFQVQLFDRDPTAARQLAARFVYADVNFENPLYDNGMNATVGVQLNRSTAELVSANSPSIFDGDVIDFYIELGDRFPVALQPGETVTLHTLTPLDGTNIVPPNLLDPGIAILDEQGNILVSDSNSVDGKNAGLEFTASSAGSYRIAIYAEAGHGEYVIQTTPGNSLRDGDFTNDGQYTGADVDQLTQRILNYSQDPVFDLSGDRRVTLTDLNAWLIEAGVHNLPSQTAFLPGDANLDGFVDGQDFVIWNANKFQMTGAWSRGDFNADGITDGLDFLIWNSHKFQSSGRGLPLVELPGDSEDLARQAYFAQLDERSSAGETHMANYVGLIQEVGQEHDIVARSDRHSRRGMRAPIDDIWNSRAYASTIIEQISSTREK